MFTSLESRGWLRLLWTNVTECVEKGNARSNSEEHSYFVTSCFPLGTEQKFYCTAGMTGPRLQIKPQPWNSFSGTQWFLLKNERGLYVVVRSQTLKEGLKRWNSRGVCWWKFLSLCYHPKIYDLLGNVHTATVHSHPCVKDGMFSCCRLRSRRLQDTESSARPCLF